MKTFATLHISYMKYQFESIRTPHVFPSGVRINRLNIAEYFFFFSPCRRVQGLKGRFWQQEETRKRERGTGGEPHREVLPSSRVGVEFRNSRFHASQFGESRWKNNTPPTSTRYRESVRRRILTVKRRNTWANHVVKYRVSNHEEKILYPKTFRSNVLLKKQRGRYCSYPMTVEILAPKYLTKTRRYIYRHLGTSNILVPRRGISISSRLSSLW